MVESGINFHFIFAEELDERHYDDMLKTINKQSIVRIFYLRETDIREMFDGISQSTVNDNFKSIAVLQGDTHHDIEEMFLEEVCKAVYMRMKTKEMFPFYFYSGDGLMLDYMTSFKDDKEPLLNIVFHVNDGRDDVYFREDWSKHIAPENDSRICYQLIGQAIMDQAEKRREEAERRERERKENPHSDVHPDIARELPDEIPDLGPFDAVAMWEKYGSLLNEMATYDDRYMQG